MHKAWSSGLQQLTSAEAASPTNLRFVCFKSSKIYLVLSSGFYLKVLITDPFPGFEVIGAIAQADASQGGQWPLHFMYNIHAA